MTQHDGFFWFEDMAAGQVLRSPRAITLDRDAIITFARQYDPQPAHLGEDSAKDSQFGLFCASGWQTGSITMRLLVEALPIARGGMGAGIELLRWLRPVRPGDSLRVEVEVLATRPSRSRPGSGVVSYRCTTLNQDDVPVQEFTTTVLLPRREPG